MLNALEIFQSLGMRNKMQISRYTAYDIIELKNFQLKNSISFDILRNSNTLFVIDSQTKISYLWQPIEEFLVLNDE